MYWNYLGGVQEEGRYKSKSQSLDVNHDQLIQIGWLRDIDHLLVH